MPTPDPKRSPGRPPRPWPDRIPASPEEVMRRIIDTPPDPKDR